MLYACTYGRLRLTLGVFLYCSPLVLSQGLSSLSDLELLISVGLADSLARESSSPSLQHCRWVTMLTDFMWVLGI